MKSILQFTLLLAICVLFTTPTFAARGRVQIVDNNVVTDNGLPLRGETHYVLGAEDIGHSICEDAISRGLLPSNYQKPDLSDTYYWECFRAFGLNSVRVYANRSGNLSVSQIDRIVNEAAVEGFYVMIDDHHDGDTTDETCCGSFTWSQASQFWNQIAPRYKDDTHVFYDAKNEPVAWDAAAYGTEAKQFQRDIYSLIRGHAPDTHITLWSFSHDTYGMVNKVDEEVVGTGLLGSAIDYKNASVSYHVYGGDTNPPICDPGVFGTVELRSKYPILQTEIGSNSSIQCEYLARTIAHEDLGISWFWLNGYRENIPITWQPDPWAVAGPTPTIDPNAPTATPAPTLTPVPTSPPAGFPGRIQAESFDLGGALVGFYEGDDFYTGGPGTTVACRSGMGDPNDPDPDGPDLQTYGPSNCIVGYISADDWLAYSVDIPQAGLYQFDFSVASTEASQKSLHISLDAQTQDISGPFAFDANTGSWEVFKTVSGPQVQLPAGTHTLYLAFESNNFNLDYLTLL